MPLPLLQLRGVALLALILATPALVLADLAEKNIGLQLPRHRLEARELAVIVNDKDPLSVRIGEYYVKARRIPAENLLRVSFKPGRSNLPARKFRHLLDQVRRMTPEHIQAWAITWASPYRVDCMSITSAFTFGFDEAWCSRKRCAATAINPWFSNPTSMPYTEFGMRPTMAIAATDFARARALIDRGIASDGSQPDGVAYLLSTSDRARNVRAVRYPLVQKHFNNSLDIAIIQADSLKDRKDVLFYFTGKSEVRYLDSLRFVPGAVADHLTSAGGKLTDSRQMSSLRWLEAGATGSYGTVVEPCNRLGKFPEPAVLLESYTHGRTLLEAYWQSVQQPGEGIFIGEPLAAPFDGFQLTEQQDTVVLTTRVLLPGRYLLYSSAGPVGPYMPTGIQLKADLHQTSYRLPRTKHPYLKLVFIAPPDSTPAAAGIPAGEN